MNKDKFGKPFHYPYTFVLLLRYAKACVNLPFGQTEDILSLIIIKSDMNLLPL